MKYICKEILHYSHKGTCYETPEKGFPNYARYRVIILKDIQE